MADKGIIYIMTTVVEGLIKIGSTGSSNFEQRMYHLEHNGYCNVTGLKRAFAIEVEDYKDKETLLDKIFEKSCVPNTELFALDVNIAKQLLSSFEGKVVYPRNETKSEIFNSAANDIRKEDSTFRNSEDSIIPDGTYFLKRKNSTIFARATVTNNCWTILKGSIIVIGDSGNITKKGKEIREKIILDNEGRLLENIELGECKPTLAGMIVLNNRNNGWREWCTETGKPIDIYRNQ